MHQHYRHPSDGQAHAMNNAAAAKNMSPPSNNTTNTSSASSTSTVRRQSVPAKDTVEVIPSSNAIDSAMYERDKQIYKCSTMRPGGKIDPKMKPAIMNCPLPEIPKAYQQSTDSDNERKYGTMAGCRTFQRNSKMAGLKPIQPPKILTSPTPVQQNRNINQPHDGQRTSVPANNSVKIYSTGNLNNNNSQQIHQNQQRPVTAAAAVETLTTNLTTNPNSIISDDNDDDLPPPPPTLLSPIDDSNYAVTEL